MPQYGGKRGQAEEAPIVQRGGEKVADLIVEGGKAKASKYEAIGEGIGSTLSVAAQGIRTERERRTQAEQFAQTQKHQQYMQREKFLGESAIEGQKQQGRQAELKMELEGRQQEQARKMEFEAATEGKVTFDKESGSYKPSPLAAQGRILEHNLKNAQRTSILSKIANDSEQLKLDMAKAKILEGKEAAEIEDKAKGRMLKSIDDLSRLELDAMKAAERGDENPLSAPMSGKEMEGQGFGPKGPQGREQLLKFAENMRTARNLQAFHLCAETGETTHIIPGSKEQTIMTNTWIPQVKAYLASNPMIVQIAMKKGMTYAAKMTNRMAAQLTMMQLADPDIALAMAQALQTPGMQSGEQEFMQRSGVEDGGTSGTEPGGGPEGPGGGGGISIPRERR